MNLQAGCRMDPAEWAWLNRTGCFQQPDYRRFVSPFPPVHLMENVSGLRAIEDFAAHGADFFLSLSAASPRALAEYRSILDFGCGCGRLARMFKGHPGRVVGCDIDARHVTWINQHLDFMEARLSRVRPPLPFADDEFDAVISISIFSHLNERSQDEFLAELHRVSAGDGFLFITVHGERALTRAMHEPGIFAMLAVEKDAFARACREFAQGKHAFIIQDGHLTTTLGEGRGDKAIRDDFEYGITFIPETYIRSHWTKWFEIVDCRSGGIHDFQDIVVLKPRK